MRQRDLTEFAAIPVVAVILGALALVMVAFDAGIVAWLVLGIGVALVAAVAVWFAASRDRHPAQGVAPATPSHAGDRTTHRVLVVADDCATDDAFVSAVAAHAAGRHVDVLVVAPALGSRRARWTSDERAYVDAQRHVDATVAALGRAGIDARGHVGSHDPVQAADDGLRELPADEIVFVTHPPESSSPLERDVVEVARARYGIPVAHLVVRASS